MPKVGGTHRGCSAGQFGEDFAMRLQHVSDSAIVLGSVSDDSDIHRIIPDPKRQDACPVRARALLEQSSTKESSP